MNDDRIFGGQAARPGQFPYIVSLRKQQKVNKNIVWQHDCGGSILNNWWIISVAHCTFGYYSNSSRVVIVVGAHHIQNDGKIHRLDRIVNHPLFNWPVNTRNDICLLRTKTEIQYNNFVQPISLSKEFVGADVASIVSGWGVMKVRKKNCVQCT